MRKKIPAVLLTVLTALTMAACGERGAEYVQTITVTTRVVTVTSAPETAAEPSADGTEFVIPPADGTEFVIPPADGTEFVIPPAEDFEYCYDAALNGVKISAYIGSAPSVRVPAEIDGEPVVSIGEYAFADCESLETLALPDSLANIGRNAFEGCNGLTVTYNGREYDRSDFDDLYALFD